MDVRVRRFRKDARVENGGRTGRCRRYSRGLRARAVAYLREQMQGGSSPERVASELGVSGWSLVRWSREVNVEKACGLRAVEVVAEGSETAPGLVVTLVTPDGYRVEGLRALEVGSVLEGLR